ncbi:MAG: hypothetical protein ACPGLV_07580, partial [Bacteroidia bacterium]
MKRINSGFGKIFLIALFGLLSSVSLKAQTVTYDISAIGNPYEGCEDYFVTFEANITGTFDSVELWIDNARAIQHDDWDVSGSDWSKTRVFDAGTYNPILKVKSNGIWKDYLLTEPIKVYSNPTADFIIINEDTDSSQCFKGNEFCFEDRSKPGLEGHKLVSWSFDLGDGNFKYKMPTCHSYNQAGDFEVILTVLDEKGCEGIEVKEDYPEVYKQIGADFAVQGDVPAGCPDINVTFKNKTPFDTAKIAYWIWDWGIGRRSKDTFYMRGPLSNGGNHYDNWWTDFTRLYNNDGYTSPKLVVVANDGCRDSLLLKDAIRVIDIRFDMTWVPDTPCFTDNSITFNMPPRPNATQFQWTFGDPASMQLNVNRESWSPEHVFVGGPGFYNVTLAILEPPCPVVDSTLCFVKLRGPSAAINLPAPPFPGNNCVDPREIPKADFERIKYDECWRESQDIEEVQFVWVNSSAQSKRDSYYVYCNPLVDSYMVILGAAGDGAVSCGPTFTIAKQDQWVTKDIFKKVYPDATPWMWSKEDFRPSGVTKFLKAGESRNYIDMKNQNQVLTATADGFYTVYCKSFEFLKHDSIPRNPVIIDSIKIYEEPIEGVNGNWVYRYNNYAQSFRPTWNFKDDIPVRDSLKITDFVTPVGGGTKVQTTFWIHQPFMRMHTIDVGGQDYIYRVQSSPIKHAGGQYYPPMYPGTQLPDCEDEWRTMHDSDKFKWDCKAPNLVTFKNNSRKYRLFGRKRSEHPTHTDYDMDNQSMAFYSLSYGYPDLENQIVPVDACNDNTNFPWASDSLYYLWDFGDNSAQCTAYYDVNGVLQARGDTDVQDPYEYHDPTDCKYSEAVAPYHMYREDGCWTARLTVYDPLLDCEAQASQPIVMEFPNSASADPAGALTEDDVNYNNQQVFQKDEDGDDFRKGMQLGVGAAPCVGNDQNPYFQRINIGETIPLCGRETFWMIFNRDDPRQGENDDPADNDCVKNECNTNGNGKLVEESLTIEERGALHNPGAYDVEFREVLGPGKWGKTYARGRAVITQLGFLDRVNVTESDSGFSNKSKIQMVFSDSTQIGWGPGRDSIIVYGYEEVDTFWWECNWIPETILQLIGMRWSYTTAGCKTPGLKIKVGDCIHEYFYEDYRYFLDANAAFQLSPNPRTLLIEEETKDRADASRIRTNIVDDVDFVVCKEPADDNLLPTKLPYRIILSVEDYERNDPMKPEDDPVCDVLDSLRNFKFFAIKTADQCGYYGGAAVGFNDSVQMHPDGLESVTNGDVRLANLRDTLHYTIKKPGKYIISSSAKAQHGAQFCFGGASSEIWVGQHQCFRYTDSVLCEGQEVTFFDSVYYWHPSGQIFCELSNWWDNTTCIDSAGFFYSPDSSSTRRGYWNNLDEYQGPPFKEAIAWDFDAPRWKVENGDSTRIEDWMRTMDSTQMEIYINPKDSQYWRLPNGTDTVIWDSFRVDSMYYEKFQIVDSLRLDNWNLNSFKRAVTWQYGTVPKFGVGVYDVTLWARDSMGCWIPYTKKNAIRVLGVEAQFALCDSCNDTLICTPATAGFQDLSRIIENEEDVPNGYSIGKGVNDEVVKWKWKWGDGRDSALIQNPGHTYLDANEVGYTVRLFVETAQGCKDSVTFKNLIKVLGPVAKFDVVVDSVCVGDDILMIDRSFSRTEEYKGVYSTDPFNTTKNTNQGSNGDTIRFNIPDTGSYNIIYQISAKVKDPLTGVEKDCDDIYPNPDDDRESNVPVYVRGLDPIMISASDVLICPNQEIIFTVDDQETFKKYNNFVWNTGVGEDDQVANRPDEVKQVYDSSGT